MKKIFIIVLSMGFVFQLTLIAEQESSMGEFVLVTRMMNDKIQNKQQLVLKRKKNKIKKTIWGISGFIAFCASVGALHYSGLFNQQDVNIDESEKKISDESVYTQDEVETIKYDEKSNHENNALINDRENKVKEGLRIKDNSVGNEDNTSTNNNKLKNNGLPDKDELKVVSNNEGKQKDFVGDIVKGIATFIIKGTTALIIISGFISIFARK